MTTRTKWIIGVTFGLPIVGTFVAGALMLETPEVRQAFLPAFVWGIKCFCVVLACVAIIATRLGYLALKRKFNLGTSGGKPGTTVPAGTSSWWERTKAIIKHRAMLFIWKALAACGVAGIILYVVTPFAISQVNPIVGAAWKSSGLWIGLAIFVIVGLVGVSNSKKSVNWELKTGIWSMIVGGIFVFLTAFAPTTVLAVLTYNQHPYVSFAILKSGVDEKLRKLGPAARSAGFIPTHKAENIDLAKPEPAAAQSVGMEVNDLPEYLLGGHYKIPKDGKEIVIRKSPAETAYVGKYLYRAEFVYGPEIRDPNSMGEGSQARIQARYYDEKMNLIGTNMFPPPKVTTQAQNVPPERVSPLPSGSSFFRSYYVGYSSLDGMEHTVVTGFQLLPEDKWEKDVQPVRHRK